MSYFSELRRNVRPLLAASLGSGSGLMLMAYLTTIFGPYLVEAFGWSRAQFALIGLSMFSTLIALPFIGRLTDRIGVRRAALIGHVGIPLCLLGYSVMEGNFWVYFALSCTILAVGSFTSPVVWTRPIAADFKAARGLALTVVTITPALFGAIAAPVMTGVIESFGWRNGYRAAAAVMLVLGVAAVLLVPGHDRAAVGTPSEARRPARADFRLILTSGPFWIIFFGMLLCTLQTPLHSSQMGMMLRDNGLGAAGAAAIISVYGIGTVIGRFACGLALDRFPAPPVATISMILPAAGFVILASPVDTMLAIGFAMFLVGVAMGAEGDLLSYLVARHYDLHIFSTTLGLVYCSVYLASASGALGISVILGLFDSFAPFLGAMAVAVVAGSLLFLLLPKDGRFARIG